MIGQLISAYVVLKYICIILIYFVLKQLLDLR